MRTLPTDRHIDDLAKRIADYRAAETAASLKAVLNRARRARSNTPDGFPCATMGGGTGTAELTSVESAASRRIDGSTKDPLDTALRRCLAHLESAVHALDLLTVAVGSLSNILVDPEPLNRRTCWAMARVEAEDDFYRRVTIGDTAYDLGRFAYQFYVDTGILPSIAQCRQKALGRKVMHRADA